MQGVLALSEKQRRREQAGTSGRALGPSVIDRETRKLIFALAMATLHASSALANPVHDQILQLSEAERRAFFAIFLSGKGCNTVTKTFHQGNDTNGKAYWNAQCSGGTAWAIQVDGDRTGSTRILDCKLLDALMGSATCFTKLK